MSEPGLVRDQLFARPGPDGGFPPHVEGRNPSKASQDGLYAVKLAPLSLETSTPLPVAAQMFSWPSAALAVVTAWISPLRLPLGAHVTPPSAE